MPASNLFQKLCESTSVPYEPTEINQYRLFCYAFRAGGFVDVVRKRIEDLQCRESKEFLQEAVNCLGRIQELRAEPVPFDYSAWGTFNNYVGYTNGVLTNLKAAKAVAKEKQPIQKLYDSFETAMDRVRKSNGIYPLNFNDCFLLEHGAIDLPDQGLKIIQMVFTNDLGLHFAIASPGSSFYHSHKYLSELHFVEGKCPYEHYVNKKRFRVRGADVVAMKPGTPHGGRNTSKTESIKLFFIAGDPQYGPWRFDFNDRTNHSIGDLTQADDIRELNGVQLGNLKKDVPLEERLAREGQVQFPNGSNINMEFHAGEYRFTVIPEQDWIIRVVDGQGKITIGGIEAELKPNDCLSLPGGIEVLICSDGMSFLKLDMYKERGQ